MNSAMYGLHSVPVSIQQDGILLSAVRVGDGIMYTRNSTDEETEKMLLGKNVEVLINPVEPINKPREITQYLLIDCAKPVVVEPRSTSKIYLTFPVAIGVFLKRGREWDILDIFTLASQKYTLYGDMIHGVLCRYWKSDPCDSIPAIDPLRQGVLALSIKNTSERWATVTKAVFNAYGMKIFHCSEMVAMRATMTLLGEHSAETTFKDSPLQKQMTKSLELYTVKKLSVISQSFTMMDGI